jgi:hypothetical protein
MAVNREHWRRQFWKLPGWLCPTCQSGSLVLNKETLNYSETGISRGGRALDAWEPDWIDERFSGLLVCQSPSCGELVAIGGRTHHVENHDWENQEQDWDRKYEPKFMYPAPPVFPIPKMCPEHVAEALKKSFALFWSDKGACANRLRAVAEALLTDKKVPYAAKNGKGKKIRISLHDRIQRFRRIDPGSADYLLAIKWLGNAGSHANFDELGGDDLLNGFELFEHVIESVYVQRERRLKKIAKAINSRKGRPAKRRKVFFR